MNSGLEYTSYIGWAKGILFDTLNENLGIVHLDCLGNNKEKLEKGNLGTKLSLNSVETIFLLWVMKID